jgi:polar amino acid transport system permease protein
MSLPEAQAGNAAELEETPAETAPRVVRTKHPGRWIAVGVELLLLAMAAHAAFTQPNFRWDVVGHYLVDHSIMAGLVMTIELTISAMFIGIVLGGILAVMRLSDNPVLSRSAQVYIWFFRGTPALVQILFWFNLAALFPTLGIGIPFGPEFITASPNTFMTPFLAANLGLGLNQGAYMAEIVRAGILGIDPGQAEAASALGLRRSQTLRKIVLPQAMRSIIPPTSNETIGMLKYTSLASVIAVTEVLQSAQLIYQRTFEIIPLLIVASIWYLVLTTLLTFLQQALEKRFGRGTTQVEQAGGLRKAVWKSIAGRRQRALEPLTNSSHG